MEGKNPQNIGIQIYIKYEEARESTDYYAIELSGSLKDLEELETYLV